MPDVSWGDMYNYLITHLVNILTTTWKLKNYWKLSTLLFATMFKTYIIMNLILQVILKDFAHKYKTAENFRKAFWRTLFLKNTSRWLFLSFKSISILFWHPAVQQVSGIACCCLSRWERLASQFMFIVDSQEIVHAY